MIQQVFLVGRLGREPEMRTSKDGSKSFTNFTVATNYGYGDKAKTSWFNCTAFGKTAEFINQYGTKGATVFVGGDIVDEEYTNQKGETVKTKKVLANAVRLIGPKTEKAEATETVSGEESDFWR